MRNERSSILTSTEKPTTSKADPPDPGPHRTQARRPLVPCYIGPQYGIISTVMIPAVSSGATWTLSFRNFLWTCITQVQSTLTTTKLSIFGEILCNDEKSHTGTDYSYVTKIAIFEKLKMINGRHFEKCYRSISVTPGCDEVKLND